MFYSKSKKAFYSKEIHGGNIPLDAVEIDEHFYLELLAGQANGLQISPDESGAPLLQVLEPACPGDMVEAVKASRYSAYIAEADPLYFKWQRGEATKEEWLAKVEEVKLRFPY
ncbi:MAG: hypothetical protein K2X64_03080 [Rhodocyclaceae bacterium]|nr:hypothetical protein [Rhodocyclaceae bacterium]